MKALPPHLSGHHGSRATRHPTVNSCASHGKYLTAGQRHAAITSSEEPPRAGHNSSSDLEDVTASLFDRAHHSQTLPSISWIPNALGSFEPTPVGNGMCTSRVLTTTRSLAPYR